MPYTKDFHFSPLGQRGGIGLYPTAGILRGIKLSLTNATGFHATNTSDALVTVSAGAVRYDGYEVELASNLNATLTTPFDLSTDTATIKVYLNPTRKTDVVLPTDLVPAVSPNGSYVKCNLMNDNEFGPYGVVEQIYLEKGNVWTPLDPFKDFRQDTYGWNNMPFNEILPTITAANVSLSNEIPLFLQNGVAPHVARALSMFRQSQGILLAEIKYEAGQGVIVSRTPEYNLLPV